MKDRFVILVAVGVLCLSVGSAAVLTARIQRVREDLQLVLPTANASSMPPHVAIVTAALGTFRGLAVDVLWARADHLQEIGEFYESQTLAQWITTLQPRFQKVWAFQAWNMAYNITAATQVPAERWGWVSRGIELLRASGIPLNPKAANLYFDLAWLFQNKIGRVGDKEHWYYKARFAAEMHEILGDLTGGRTAAEAITRFREIAESPDSLDALLESTPDVKDVLSMLQEHKSAPDEKLVRMLGRVLMASGSLDAKLLGRSSLPEGTNTALVEAILADPRRSRLLTQHLIPCLQRRILVDHYHMDPSLMLADMEKYGPLDWRHPLSHGIYWTERGIDVSRSLTSRIHVNELGMLRSRLLLLMEMLRQGRLEFDVTTDRVDYIPDPRFARAYEAAIQEAFDLIVSDEGVSTAVYGLAEELDLYETYEKFLHVATMMAYLYGDEPEAERYFLTLRELMRRQNKADDPLFSDSVENFVAVKFSSQVRVNLADLREFLDAMIRRAIVDGLGQANFKVFNRYLSVANTVYQKRFVTTSSGEHIRMAENRLLEFPELVDNSFLSILRDKSIPLLTRARIWAWSPEHLRQAAYSQAIESLAAEAVADGLDPERTFPPPADAPRPPDRPSDAAPASDSSQRSVVTPLHVLLSDGHLLSNPQPSV